MFFLEASLEALVEYKSHWASELDTPLFRKGNYNIWMVLHAY